MTFENINFALTLLGIIIGFVSIYPRMKLFFARLFRLSSESVNRWMQKEDELAELFLTYPSALISYSSRALVLVVTAWVVGNLYARAIATELTTVNPIIDSVLRAAIYSLPGLQIGRLFSVFNDVISLAKRKQRASRSSG